jgi:hypothetical protein
MDYKCKHFTEKAGFQADRNTVVDAVRAFAADWLGDWKPSESAGGNFLVDRTPQRD